MASLRNVEGKGLGCIANCKIKRGTLIEREEPALKVKVLEIETYSENLEQSAGVIIDGFNRMVNKSKEDYLKLCNKFKMLDPKLPDYNERLESLPKLREIIRRYISTSDLRDIDVETAAQVFEIYKTNTFPNGVFLKISRFNHSCVANAEYVYPDKENVSGRALKNSKKMSLS